MSPVLADRVFFEAFHDIEKLVSNASYAQFARS
jgi:hypothetical protein